MTVRNLIIATHGKFGAEMLRSAEMIVGKIEHVHVLSLLPQKSFEEFYQEADEVLAQMDGSTIALVDLFGGTPSNVLTALTKKYQLKVLTGLNLPVFLDLYLKIHTKQEFLEDELLEECLRTFHESIVITNDRLYDK